MRCFTRASIVCAIATVIFAGTAHAGNAKVEHKLPGGRTSVDNSRTFSEINSKAGQHNGSWLGMTSSGMVVNVRPKIGMISFKEGEVCVKNGYVEIMVGYSAPKIFVAKELSNNPCQMNLVQEHEKRHAHVYDRVNEYIAKEAGRIVEETKTKIANLCGTSSKDVHGKIGDLALSPLKDLIRKSEAVVEKVQKEIDSPEFMRREQELMKSCVGPEKGKGPDIASKLIGR